MVILSLPFVSNSFLGHPDKSEFSAEAGQATLMQINHVRYRTLILPPRLFAMPPDLSCRTILYYRTQADTRLIAKQSSGGEFRACAQKVILFFFAQMLRPEYVEDDGRLQLGVSK
jgi:hypothetical protein